MNSIPKNYLAKLDIRETQEAQQFINKELINILEQKLEFLIIREPKISSKKISTFSNESEIKRPVNFDSSFDNIIYFIFNRYRYWFTNTLKLLNIKNNNGIASFINFIDRDEEVTNTQSVEKNTLQFEFRYDNKNNAFKKAEEYSEILLSAIKTIESKIVNKYSGLKKVFPKKNTIKDVSRIGAIAGAHSVIDELASDHGFFILNNKRKSKSQQSLRNNFEIKYLGYSRHINKAYEIFHIHDRKTIEDLEPLSSESKAAMEEYTFAKEQLNNVDVRSISITIDLDTLALALLEKSHILELQSGKNIYDIEKILDSAEIKHL